MNPAAQRWLGITSGFPSGRTAKLVLLAAVIGLVALDTTGGDFDLTKARDWFDLILPWTPLFAILIGPRVAVITWFVMFAAILAQGADPVQVSGTALPTMLLVGLCSFVLVWRAAALFTAGILVMLALALLVNPEKLGLGGVVTFATLTVLAAAAGFGLSLLRSRLERTARRVAELRVQQAQVRADERTRLAYELHDIVAGQVTLIAMQARRAEFADSEKTGQILDHIGNAAAQTLQDLRSLVLLLKSEEEDAPADAVPEDATRHERDSTGGPVEDVHRVAAELEEAGFTVRVAVEGTADVSASLRQVLARTARELGTNILKHGDPNGVVEIRLTFTSEDVTLSASNQVAAGVPVFSTGTGLEAMRARSDVFGGRLDASADGARWITSISLPSARRVTLAPPEDPA